LSVRELEVLTYIAAGWSNAQIAQAPVVVDSTIKSLASSIFGKLGVKRHSSSLTANTRELCSAGRRAAPAVGDIQARCHHTGD
jgi:ATP/maltotriose-dependent transcriptional regulator MalT